MTTQATKAPCDMWHHLLHGKIPYGDDPYTAPFYHEFVNDRDNLVDHLKTCNQCRRKVSMLSNAFLQSPLTQMPFDDFRIAIGKLRDLAIARWQNFSGKIP